MVRSTKLAGSLVLLLVLGGTAVPAPPGEPDLERLRGLAGTWALLDDQDEPSGLRATYRVVAGGSAVVETLLAGTPEETVTVYHVEGGRVTATQLSGRCDPVRLVPADRAVVKDPDELRLEAASGKAKKGAVLVLTLTLLGEDRLRIAWTLGTEDGALTFRFFEMRREASVEELAAEVARLRVSLETLERELDRRLKREVGVERKGEPRRALLLTRTLPPGPGWSVSGVPLQLFLHRQTTRYASTFGPQGDKGMTVAHYGFRAGPGCRVRFSLLGGHGFVSVVEETRAPPRRIKSIPEFEVKLGAGEYGTTIEKVVGLRWAEYGAAVEWDLSKFEGKSLRLYVVDAKSDHWGQISISEVSIVEEAPR